MPKLPVNTEYDVIFEHSKVAILVTDGNDKVILFNGCAERLLGLDESSLPGMEIAGLYPPQDWESINVLRKKGDGGLREFRSKLKRQDGSFVDVALSATAVKNAKGSVIESTFIIKDMSRSKAVKNEDFSDDQTKREFLAMVSHEMRTPLTAIKGSLGILLEGATGALNEEQKDFLAIAQRNADRLEIQINNVLDYQRLESGMYEFKFSSGNVDGVIETVITEMEFLAQKKDLKLHLVKAEGLPATMMDAERLKRAVRNLVDNAIKFTSQGEILITTSLESGQIAIHIKDTGVGIEREDKEKLFEHFFQVSSGHGRQTGSLGLGLVIARKIISAHQGDIKVETKPGEGSTFSIYLPIIKEQG